MALQSSWVHGHSANIELNDRGRGPGEDIGGRQWTAIEGLRVGPGVEYRCQDDSAYWFHFAIPTPVIVDGVRARLRKSLVLFTAGAGVTLSAVHVWDGPNRVYTEDSLASGGLHLHASDLPDREVEFGVGISVLFRFADAGSITLHAAGIDFEA